MKSIIVSLKVIVTMALIVVISFSAYAATKPLEVVELNRYNTYIWSNEIDSVTTDEFIAALIGKRILLDNIDINAKLYVVIISRGGSYDNSIIIKRLISNIPNVTLICKYCASAAGFIFATTAAPRLAIKKSILLTHEMYLAHFTAENAKDPSIVKSLIKSSDEFNKAMYTKIGISKEEYEKKIINKEWTLRGEELVKNNLADKLVIVKCDEYISTLAPDTCSQ